jgi:Zn-dependent protease with chaperone function
MLLHPRTHVSFFIILAHFAPLLFARPNVWLSLALIAAWAGFFWHLRSRVESAQSTYFWGMVELAVGTSPRRLYSDLVFILVLCPLFVFATAVAAFATIISWFAGKQFAENLWIRFLSFMGSDSREYREKVMSDPILQQWYHERDLKAAQASLRNIDIGQR